MTLLLASASPRRAELLRGAGISFEVASADLDESPLPGESPEGLVRRLALAKAQAVSCRFPGRKVLAADTVVVLDGAILGKPRDAAEAVSMLRSLSGRTHEVRTGFAILKPGGEAVVDSVRSRVTFRELSPAEIRGYVRGGEPLDKAGAYAIQGGAADFVGNLEGSHSNVVGLPLEVVLPLL